MRPNTGGFQLRSSYCFRPLRISSAQGCLTLSARITSISGHRVTAGWTDEVVRAPRAAAIAWIRRELAAKNAFDGVLVVAEARTRRPLRNNHFAQLARGEV